MSLLADVKVRLRISAANVAFDLDINDLIDEAKTDINRAGVVSDVIIDTDPAISRAIKAYCRAFFDMNEPDQERWQKIYESQRDSLSLDGDYNGLGI